MEIKKTQNTSYVWFYARPVTSGVFVLLILLSVAAYITFLSFQIERKNNQRELSNIISVIDQNIDQSLDNNKLVAFTMAMTLNDQGVPVNFEKVAAELVRSHNSVDAVQLVPDGVIKYVYPYEENKSVLGYNILQDKHRNKEAYKAIAQRKMFFAGPFELRQGGMGIVGRLPIFINDKFWGFSAVVIKLETLFKNAGIDTSLASGYRYQFAKINPDTKKTEYFFKEAGSFPFEHAESTFIQNGEWTLYVAPAKDIKTIFGILALAALGVLIAIISGLFVTSILKKPAKLQALVREQSKELIKTGQRNKAILEALPDMLFILDMEANIIYHHNPAKLDTIAPPSFFLGKNVTEVMPPQLAKEISANVRRTISSAIPLLHNYQLEGPEGVRHFEARYAKINDKEVLSVVREITRQKHAEEEILVMNQELRNLSDHLQTVREEERESLSRELHDELGQQLTAISLDLHWIRKTIVGADENLLRKLDDAISLVKESSTSVKRINTELRPSILDDLGLVAAIEWQLRDFSQRHDIKTTFNCECEDLKISSSRSIAIFRIIQESLNNISKHAQATKVQLHGFEVEANLKIIIEDNGIGFSEKEVEKNITFGFLGMKERANMLNGHVHITSEIGLGTRVELCLPLDQLNNDLNYLHKKSAYTQS